MPLAPGNTAEAGVLEALAVYPVASLAEAAAFLNEEHPIARARADPADLLNAAPPDDVDFGDVRGQAHAKRALEIAAAGGHHVILIGPPGPARRSSHGGCRRSCRPSRWPRRSR